MGDFTFRVFKGIVNVLVLPHHLVHHKYTQSHVAAPYEADGQTARWVENDAYEPTLEKHRCAKNVGLIVSLQFTYCLLKDSGQFWHISLKKVNRLILI